MSDDATRTYLRRVIERAIETGEEEVVSRPSVSALALERLALEEIEQHGWSDRVDVRVSEDEYSLVIEPLTRGFGRGAARPPTK